MTARRCLIARVAALGLALAGCHSPEDGRPRAGGNGGDGGNYAPGRVSPPSKIDATKDLGAIDHHGPRP